MAIAEARSGVALSGQTPSGYLTAYRSYVMINGVDRSSDIEFANLRTTLNIHHQPDTVVFSMAPGASSPTIGQTVLVCVGASDNRIFGGQVIRKRHVRQRAADKVRIEVECTDWMRLFSQKVVQKHWTNESATTIALDAIWTYASDFGTSLIERGLPTIDFLPGKPQTLGELFTQLAQLIGPTGWWDIDPYKRVILSTSTVTVPGDITNSSQNVKGAFVYEQDDRQRRSRVYVITKGTTTLADVARGQLAIPVDDVTVFKSSGGGSALIADYGVFTYGSVTSFRTATTVNTAASAGATSLVVDDLSVPVGVSFYPGWLLVAGEIYVYYTGGTAGAGSTGTLTGIPASGAGSLTRDVAVGDAVANVPFLASLLDGVYGVARAIPAGTAVNPWTTRNDTSAQTAIAAIEGGDGIHEVVRDATTFGIDDAAAIGDAELSAYADGSERVVFETTDPNVVPGAQQTINLTGTDTISTTLTVMRVTIHWENNTQIPRRLCEAALVRPRDLFDSVGLQVGTL